MSLIFPNPQRGPINSLLPFYMVPALVPLYCGAPGTTPDEKFVVPLLLTPFPSICFPADPRRPPGGSPESPNFPLGHRVLLVNIKTHPGQTGGIQKWKGIGPRKMPARPSRNAQPFAARPKCNQPPRIWRPDQRTDLTNG